jgi:hypothetical protein
VGQESSDLLIWKPFYLSQQAGHFFVLRLHSLVIGFFNGLSEACHCGCLKEGAHGQLDLERTA